jgi:hypothetical protein
MIINIAPYTALGFNESQATTLAWAEHYESRMAEVEYRYQGLVDGTIRIDVYCEDCKQGGQFLPSTTRDFITAHKGHSTKSFKVR